MQNIKELLQLVIDRSASDLHLVVGYPPMLRIDGELTPVVDGQTLTQETVQRLLQGVMSSDQLERMSVNKEIDYSVPYSDRARFRVNAYNQRGTWAASFRGIPVEIPTVDALGLPPIIHSFAGLRQGFVLVTGPTGHGKSTTLAAILDEINSNRASHIVTIEDPIEFVFPKRRSIVSQREMGNDSHSWSVALKSVLREDPDVVLVGEMRDYETIASALTIAETGHLVFATLHTNSAAQTIDRIVDVFPNEQQTQVKLQLSNVLEAVFSQRLIPALNGGRVVAHETMLSTTAIMTAIREGKTHQLDSIIQTSSESGNTLLETSLASLISEGKIAPDVAKSYSIRPDELNRILHRTAG
jgi:twitching motility protein PilT